MKNDEKRYDDVTEKKKGIEESENKLRAGHTRWYYFK